MAWGDLVRHASGFLLVVGVACSSDATHSPTPASTMTPSPMSSLPARVPPSPPPNAPPVLDVRLSPRPLQGSAPLTVTVDACRSRDADGDRLQYAFEFALEGKTLVDSCRAQHTYASPVRTRAIFCVTDGRPDHLVCSTHDVRVE